MAHADWIIDLGPGAGHDGGRIVFEGTPADLVAARVDADRRAPRGLRRQHSEGAPIEKGDPMNWNNSIRQTHRFMAVAFTVAVIGAFIALAQKKEPLVWVSYLPLLPLALLQLTGLYMFVLPYATKWRSGRLTAGSDPRLPR